MSDEMTFTLHNPLTEEECDMITDVDLDHTPEITFHTKHGKEAVFVKHKTGKWVRALDGNDGHVRCDKCFKIYDWDTQAQYYNFCPNCGADMRGEQE